ncbi:AEC family transporter [Synechocystis sp. LKSZ1]|uniref:AEC family transporter n=1 Tax=Synechocystis sp. LKSZ1 TaxID=3144951 RepID=UPI00336C06B5
MNPFLNLFLRLYLPIGSAWGIGFLFSFLLQRDWIARRFGPAWYRTIPAYLGKFLFLVGVPFSVVNFIRRANWTGAIWLAPVVAWGAILLAWFCSWLWLRALPHQPALKTRSSFTLSSMVGNTGYLGFPVTLLLPQLGPDYFGWALLYDVPGTFFGAYGLGFILAAQTYFRSKSQSAIAEEESVRSEELMGEEPFEKIPFSPNQSQISLKSLQFWQKIVKELLKNPSLLAFFVGLALRGVAFPEWLDGTLNGFAWGVIMLSLVLMGMRLQQLDSWRNLPLALGAVSIKMFLVPLIIAMLLTSLGMEGPPRLVLILQSAMPCAFATLVLTEAYDLDRDLVVTALGMSSLALGPLLPLWLWGFATW